MTGFNAQKFFINLSDEDAKIVMGFTSPVGLEAFIRERGIDASEYIEYDNEELTADQLDEVTDGKGFIPAALASIMLFSTVGNIAASADSAPAGTTAIVNNLDFQTDSLSSSNTKINFGMGEFDWGESTRGMSEKLINKGVSALFENIPIVGEMFADPVCDLITTALGIKEEEVDLKDIDKKLDEVIENLHEFKDKLDIFELSYDIAKKHYMINNETIEAVDQYIAKVMAEYMTAYTVAMAALDAHRTLITASPEEFDPENIADKTNKRWFDSNSTTTSDISSNISRLADILYGNGNERKDSIFYSYNAFNARSKTAYINKGQETQEMFLASHTCLDGDSNFNSFFKNGSLSSAEIDDILKLAKEKGMSIRQYLEYNGQEVPSEAKYLMISGIKTKDERRWNSAIGWCHDMTKYVEAIELNDEDHKIVELAARTYWTSEDPTEPGERNVKKYSYTFLSFADKKAESAAAPLGSSKEMENGLYKLSSDYKMDKCYVVANGRSVTIDLNGCKLDRGLSDASSASDDGCHFKVEKGAHLTIIDTKGGGVVTGGYGVKGGAINVANGASCSVLGCIISDNRAKIDGGGIYLTGKDTVNNVKIDDCTVTGNTAQYGAGVYVDKAFTTNINNSVIKDNHASINGGGVFMNYTIYGTNFTYMSLALATTEISENSAANMGGGIYSLGVTIMNDGIIKGNTAHKGEYT